MIDLHNLERPVRDEFTGSGQQLYEAITILAFARNQFGIEGADASVHGAPIRHPHAGRQALLGDPLDQQFS